MPKNKINQKESVIKEPAFLYDIFMNIPTGIAIVKGEKHIFEFANVSYEKMVNRKIVIGKTVKELFPELEEQGTIALLDHVFETGEPYVIEESIIYLEHQNNPILNKHYFNLRFEPVKDKNNKIGSLLIHAIDVTQHVNARKQIEDSEKRFTNLLTQSMMAIAILKGKNMIVTFANEKILDAWDKGKDVIGKPFLSVLPELIGQGFSELLQQVYTSGVPYYGYESKVVLWRNNKEETLYYNFVYEPYIEVDNSISGITILATDVTQNVIAKKQVEASEAFNRTILQSSPDCLKVLDTKGRIQFMNLNGLCQMEIEDFSDVKNKSWSSIWSSENHPVVKASIKKALSGEPTEFIAQSLTGKGTLKWWDVKVSPVGKPGDVINQIISVSRDITEQKNVEEDIKKLASHLKLTTDSANIGTWSLNIERQKLEWSHLHKKMWGYDENFENLSYEDWHRLISTEDKEMAVKNVEDAKINQSEYDQSYHITRANDGALRYMRSIGKYYYHDNGKAHTLSGITIDCTEQKAAEQKIAESEKQFRTFADSIQNLAWIANAEGWIYFYNKQWYDYTGTTLDEMEGWGWAKVHHPDHVNRIIEVTKELWKKDESFELTFPIRRHDGIYRWFLTRAYPVKDASGTIERWIGTNTDITEQKTIAEELETKVKKRTEELYVKNKTFEMAEKIAKFGSYKWNISTGLLKYSDNLYLLLDCEPKAFEPSFEKFLSFIHPDDLQEVIKNGEETMITGQLIETPYRIISEKGVIKHFRSSGSFIGENENRVLIGTVQDITKDIVDSIALKTKNLELEQINEEIKSFTHIASHDLQEPLRKIQMLISRILDAEVFSNQTQDYFNRIVLVAERMQNLIIDLLDFSRLEKAELIFNYCDLNAILEESKNDLYINIEEKKATILHEKLPIIKGIHLQLYQLFTNLIDNAIKYSQNGIAPEIKISLALIHGSEIDHPSSNDQQEYNVIKIADNGIGFKEEYNNKIFELFQRLHHKEQYSGTGIGLAIVKKVVNNHKGFIVAKGKENIGSIFIIYLPIF